MAQILKRDDLLARLWYFAPSVPVPLTMLTATIASLLPQLSPEEHFEQVAMVAAGLMQDDLIVFDRNEYTIMLTAAGQQAAENLPDLIRQAAADPIERIMSEWKQLLSAGDTEDLSATAQRWEAHTTHVGRRASQRGDDKIAAGMALYVGEAAMQRRDLGTATEAAQRALQAGRRIKAAIVEVLALDLLSRVAFYQGDLPAAARHAQAAWRIARTRAPKQQVSTALRLAGVLIDLGRHEQAIQILAPLAERARQGTVSLTRSQHTSLLQCYGTSLTERGNASAGLSALREAVALAQSGDEGTEIVSALTDLAIALGRSGQLQEAVATFEEALQAAQRYEAFSPTVALGLWNFAQVLIDSGNLARARGLLQRAQTMARLTRAAADVQATIADDLARLDALE